MQLVRHLPARLDRARGSAVAIGNFDGMHRGHQALIAEITSQAPALRPVVLCFDPLPATLFRPEQPVPRVMKLRDQFHVCQSLGVETLARLRFDRAFSQQQPQTFVQRVLIDGLDAKYVVVGNDFRFGHRALGDVDQLRTFGGELGFEVKTIGEISDDSGRVSSTRLRDALARGDLAEASQVLGRSYSISGRVVRGKQLGRTLGFATANLRVAEPPALSGILAARIHGAGLSGHPAVVSLGQRPTVAGKNWLLEAHLFDFSDNLYGQHLSVEFVDFIRHEEHFDSVAAMTEKMHDDAARAMAALAD